MRHTRNEAEEATLEEVLKRTKRRGKAGLRKEGRREGRKARKRRKEGRKEGRKERKRRKEEEESGTDLP